MSDRLRSDLFPFLNDEDENPQLHPEDEVDPQDYDSDSLSDDDAPIDDGDDDVTFMDYIPTAFVARPTNFEIPSFAHKCGAICPGNVVELEDDSGRATNHRVSGDFLLVRSIVENLETGNFNDLFMLLEVSEHDNRPRFVQGLEDIDPERVVRRRDCAFSGLTHDLHNMKHLSTHVPARLRTDNEKRDYLFDHGYLVCRWVFFLEIYSNGKSYGGEIHRMYMKEVTAFSKNEGFSEHAHLDESSPNADGRRRNVRQDSSDTQPRPTKGQHFPNKSRVLTCGDGFCGCGGVSEAARQAGYKVIWGLEKDPETSAAYRKNFPEATLLEMDAHDFPDMVRRCIHGCDHLHMSCPCCYWSEAHSSDGKNDEENMLTIFTVEPWLEKLKPGTFSLEQAPGLLKKEKHKLFWFSLLNGILKKNYRVRWRIQDQAWFGVAQHRKRLVVVGSKIGIPLPPFPAPTHGPPRSGLKRYLTIEDALKVIDRQAMSFRNDPYHQPQLEKRLDKTPIDPHVSLAKCITTSGGDQCHYSGKRAYTVREFAALQSFPPYFNFTGSKTTARKQCGNAWSVKSCKAYLALWAAHREAFNNGLIDDEDEVLDLYDFLEKKGIDIPKPTTIDVDADLFDRPPARNDSREPKYRYLTRLGKTTKPNFPLPLWGKTKTIDRVQRKKRNVRVSNLMDGSHDDFEEISDPGQRRGVPRKRRRHTAVYIDDEKEPIWISDSDNDSG